MNAITAALAVLPAIALIAYIYRHDTTEKEPPRLLAKLFLQGALSTIAAIVIEAVGSALLLPPFAEGSFLYLAIDNFIIVALAEEACKFVVLRRNTWNSEDFNYTFDGVVYAAMASLGFATLENILFVAGGSLGTAVARAVFSVPGHAIFGVCMGYFYGLAKRYERLGDQGRCSFNLVLALVAPVLLHGYYDFAITSEAFLPFLAFEVVMTAVAILRVRQFSREDSPL